MNGAELIAAERQRQVEVEGWTPEHDDGHDQGEMATAARCYLDAAGARRWVAPGLPDSWPWHPDWWKPSDDPVRTLTKAGALIAAEIDRLQRRPAPQGGDWNLRYIDALERRLTHEQITEAVEEASRAHNFDPDKPWLTYTRTTPCPHMPTEKGWPCKDMHPPIGPPMTSGRRHG